DGGVGGAAPQIGEGIRRARFDRGRGALRNMGASQRQGRRGARCFRGSGTEGEAHSKHHGRENPERACGYRRPIDVSRAVTSPIKESPAIRPEPITGAYADQNSGCRRRARATKADPAVIASEYSNGTRRPIPTANADGT